MRTFAGPIRPRSRSMQLLFAEKGADGLGLAKDVVASEMIALIRHSRRNDL